MDKILTFIKKYTSLLIPAGIVLVALVFIVVTTVVGGSIKEKQGSALCFGLNLCHIWSPGPLRGWIRLDCRPTEAGPGIILRPARGLREPRGCMHWAVHACRGPPTGRGEIAWKVCWDVF